MSRRSNTKALNLEHVFEPYKPGYLAISYTHHLDNGGDYETALRKLRKVRIAHPVGTHYNYQNVAYSLVADVMEKACGKSYQDLMAEKLYQPLGMSDASTSYEEIIGATNVALPHSHYKRGFP